MIAALVFLTGDGGAVPGDGRHLGFSAHDETQALRLIDTGLFETVLFPINFVAHRHGGFGAALLEAAGKKGVAVLALKAYAKCRIKPGDGVVALDLGGTLGPAVGDAVRTPWAEP
jgi:hypothetical protein